MTGARETAGRPSPWRNNKTRLVRIPDILADDILAYARMKDTGEEGENTKQDNNTIAQVITTIGEYKDLASKSKTISNWKKCNELIKRLEEILETNK